MPDEPVGGILTLDARNTSPSLSNFNVDLVRSSNNMWLDKLSVSAQYNSLKAYEYFLNTFGRNSINGSGGTIVSIINVADDNGQSMDNAFWNGEAMFYGNGDEYFTKLAKALDVGGHEMSHGVVQNTANLSMKMNQAH
jgi:Zn-dependent metalloprotease